MPDDLYSCTWTEQLLMVLRANLSTVIVRHEYAHGPKSLGWLQARTVYCKLGVASSHYVVRI